MSEWVNVKINKPPQAKSVLLYIVNLDENKNIVDDNIFVGFYDDNEVFNGQGFYTEKHTDTCETFSLVEETDNLKVIAWTLLPRRPYKDMLKNEEWSG